MSQHHRLTRRAFISASSASVATLGLSSCALLKSRSTSILINDTQSLLNPTNVSAIETPYLDDEIVNLVRRTKKLGNAIAVCGGRHAMGGQQFLSDQALLDSRSMGHIRSFDRVTGLVTVDAGVTWPVLMAELTLIQEGQKSQHWCIRQKQTGVDYVTIGGSISANIHGRGLGFAPFISDVDSLRLVTADGQIINLSRAENSELFSLVFGGYGLFGVITEVTLRLVPRKKVQRIVEIIPVRTVIERVQERISQGFVFGDCQYAVDFESMPKEHPGVFSCYRPVADDAPMLTEQKHLSPEAWGALYQLTRTNKPEAFRRYSEYYLSTNQQVYWWDTHQLAGDFFRGYQQARDAQQSTEMITEVYVTKERFLDFMTYVREELVKRKADLTFGTIRFIKKDAESFLAWAKEDYVCIVCNLHVVHTRAGISKAIEDFRSIIDCALKFEGRYYLTYHRFARKDQVERAYPQFREFLALKKKYDSAEVFQSDWYQHYKGMLL